MILDSFQHEDLKKLDEVYTFWSLDHGVPRTWTASRTDKKGKVRPSDAHRLDSLKWGARHVFEFLSRINAQLGQYKLMEEAEKYSQESKYTAPRKKDRRPRARGRGTLK